MSTKLDAADPHDLARFIEAQARVYEDVLEELRAGQKKSHWIWFIFPQIAGLGRSSTAQHFSIASMEEAKAYLTHPQLGPRLTECTSLVMQVDGKTAEEIFGSPDWMKFRSSMTLFAEAAPSAGVFQDALEKYYSGEPDAGTLTILERLQDGG